MINPHFEYLVDEDKDHCLLIFVEFFDYFDRCGSFLLDSEASFRNLPKPGEFRRHGNSTIQKLKRLSCVDLAESFSRLI